MVQQGLLGGNLEGLEHEPLGKTWSRFFPDVPRAEQETFSYPRPLGTEFWQRYAEPVDVFIDGALALKRALEFFESTKVWANQDESARKREAARTRIDQGRIILHSLVANVSPMLEVVREGELRQGWLATSLLASLAMMALQDIGEEKVILRCPVCGVIFAADAYQARYCSARCRHTAQKRAHRRKQRKCNMPTV